jgi:hypothetical protein
MGEHWKDTLITLLLLLLTVSACLHLVNITGDGSWLAVALVLLIGGGVTWIRFWLMGAVGGGW